MLFNSFGFLLFFPIVTFLYYLLPHRYRCPLLLVASCIFYAVFIPVYLFLLFALIIIDYYSGILIEENKGKHKKLFLIVSIVSMSSALFFFKYFNFFITNLEGIARLIHWNLPIGTLNLLLPIGLSFHTFQSLSYVIEVYRDKQKAERNFWIYALYVMFYPQLVAGPIERPYNLLHQFHEEHAFEYKRVVDGLKRMAWGMFQKVVIADRLAILVNQVYGYPHGYSTFILIMASIFFAFQIYCDFSGYTDIALGAAQVMGFRLMENFNRPYFSKSIAEFWRRWHISLASWFRDYIYIPLGGNRVSHGRWYFNIFITFLMSGLWHGAEWTFVIWGALNGFYLIFSIATAGLREKFVSMVKLDSCPVLHKLIQVIITFTLVCLGWVFFRAANLGDALYVIKRIFVSVFSVFNFHKLTALKQHLSCYGAGLNTFELFLAFASIAFLVFIHAIQKQGSIRDMLRNKPVYFRWFAYELLLLSILLFGVFNKAKFVYFQF